METYYKVKYFISVLFLLVSNSVFSQERFTCDNLGCLSSDDKESNYIQYISVIDNSLDKAKGCKNIKKLDEAIEFTAKIGGGAHSQETMSKFIEEEFMSNPKCILSAIKRASKKARFHSTEFLAHPTFIHGKIIKQELEKYKSLFPSEYHLVITGKEKE